MIEKQAKYIEDARKLSKEEFLEQYPNQEDLYEKLHKSKAGYITIEKISSNSGYLRKGEIQYGNTPAFGEGLSCWIYNIKEYYYTSVIQKIDWENNTFDTLNSTYKFKFDERKN